MIDTALFKACGASYEDIDTMIQNIARKIAGRKHVEMLDDLISEGWIIVMESIPNFSPERGIKLTTYLWMSVNGGLIRFATKRNKLQQMLTHNDEQMPVVSTENVPHSDVLFNNPYQMQPDTAYEKRECITLWQQLSAEFDNDIQEILEKTPKRADITKRKAISRYRKRKLSKLQASVKLMLT